MKPYLPSFFHGCHAVVEAVHIVHGVELRGYHEAVVAVDESDLSVDFDGGEAFGEFLRYLCRTAALSPIRSFWSELSSSFFIAEFVRLGPPVHLVANVFVAVFLGVRVFFFTQHLLLGARDTPAQQKHQYKAEMSHYGFSKGDVQNY